MITKFTKATVRKMASTAGISIGANSGSPYPTIEQLMVFVEEVQKTPAVSPSEMRTTAVKLAKKHKLITESAPITIGQEWAIDALVEALGKK